MIELENALNSLFEGDHMIEIDPLDVIESWDLNYHLGTAVKLIYESQQTANPVRVLQNAILHINRFLNSIDRESNNIHFYGENHLD